MKKKLYSLITIFVLMISTISSMFAESTVPTFNKLTDDGAWCWFADPRAVYHEGVKKQTYIAWVNSIGDIVIASFNHDTNEYKETIIHEKLEADDHDVPAILIRDDGRVVVFYSKHQAAGTMNRVISTLPEDISSFSSVYSWGTNVSYPNPFRTGNHIQLLYRGVNWHPTIAVSKDNGQTFSDIRQIVLNGGARPYARYCQGADGSIHVAVTTGHPRDEAKNKIFYFQLKDNKFYRADGSLIKEFTSGINLGDRTGTNSEAEVVYDGEANGRGWIWDMTIDPKTQKPVMVFASFPSESDHRYNYAYWDGSRWQHKEIVKAGKWFPQTPPGTTEREPHYSGGLSMDHENPAVVYLSKQVNGVFEIYKYETTNWGTSWSSSPITHNTPAGIVNARPIVPRNHKEGYFDVLWMRGSYEYYYKKYKTAIVFQESEFTKDALLKLPTKSEIIDKTVAVNNKWIGSNTDPGNNLWARATYHIGNIDFYKIYPENKYLDYANKWANKHNWSINQGSTTADADNHTAGQVYIDLYLLDKIKEKKKIEAITDAIDYRINEDPASDDWWWIDALFMAMPTMARLGSVHEDAKYFDKMHALYTNVRDHLIVNSSNKNMWPQAFREKYGEGPILPIHEEFDNTKQHQGLYSVEDNLWWRDWGFQPNVPPKKSPATGWATEVPKQSPNEKNIYWARGNGWVMAAMARTLQFLPENEKHRHEYVLMLQKMAAALKKCQRADGFWNMNLADSQHFPAPETSGTALITYGIAWGINNGLLEHKDYFPVVAKAWNGLCTTAIQPDGTVKYTQNVGEAPIDPKGLTNYSVDFGVGAVLLAASELTKLAEGEIPAPETKPLQITNIEVTDATHLNITFGDELDVSSATEKTNYSIAGATIVNATMNETNRVTLTLNTAIEYGRYGLVVNKVLNLSSTAQAQGKEEKFVYAVPMDTADTKIKTSASKYQNDAQYKGYPANAIDNDLNTRWAAEGKGEWLKLDLGEETEIGAVDISFYDGNKRVSYFNVAVSTDDKTYTTVLTEAFTSGLTNEMERYSFPKRQARYIKLTCNGNSVSNWNSVTEVRIRVRTNTSINEAKSNRDVKIYPNPATSEGLTVKVDSEMSGKVLVRILDITGKELLQKTIQTDEGRIAIRHLDLTAGTYLLNLTDGVNSHHGKFIVQ